MKECQDMGLLRKWLLFFVKKRESPETEEEAPEKSFFLYVTNAPRILTWLRREKGISQKNLELTVIDNGEEPAWQVEELIELLTTDLNLLYVVTDRAAVFEELSDEAFEEQGLLIVLMSPPEDGRLPGNLVLDLRDWERQMDLLGKL